MGYFSFKLPDLGEGIVESEISAWHIKPGDVVEEDQHIVDVMTDKANVEVGSPVSGKVVSLACAAGEMLAVGHELVGFDVAGDATVTDAEIPVEVKKTVPEPAPPVVVNVSEFNGTVLASPSVRQGARDEDIDLSLVPGSGPAGRVSHKDLEAFIAAGGALAVRDRGRMKKGGTKEVKVTGLRRIIAQKMQQTKRNIPHYSYIEEVDVTELETLRRAMNADRAEGLPKLTLLPFLIKALVKILPKFPQCNACFDDEAGVVTHYEGVHVGIATMTQAGLMVPVVRHAESLSIWQVAAEINRVAEAARSGVAKGEELTGSTITITSLGAIGGLATTPVINAPETSIIGVNKMQERPVIINGAIAIRTMMNLSSSFDHRIVDGFDGAQLVQALKRLLETPGTIFAEEA